VAFKKRWYVEKAFSKIGFANYLYDLQPEQLQEALGDLDSMMATWDAQGIRLGWSIPNDATASDLDDEVDVPYYAREAIFLQLGLRLAPSVGKTVSPHMLADALRSYNALMRQMAQPTPLRFPNTLPSGAGNKPWRNINNPFLGPTSDPLLAGDEGSIDFGTLVPESEA
jgi:hypothetical protein